MNSVHDMGGMQGFGPIQREANEPVFHAPWEGRVITMVVGIAAWGKFGVDDRRYVRELIPPADFLRMSYYEIWYTGLIANLLNAGMVTQAEIDSGMPAADLAPLRKTFTLQGICGCSSRLLTAVAVSAVVLAASTLRWSS